MSLLNMRLHDEVSVKTHTKILEHLLNDEVRSVSFLFSACYRPPVVHQSTSVLSVTNYMEPSLALYQMYEASSNYNKHGWTRSTALVEDDQ